MRKVRAQYGKVVCNLSEAATFIFEGQYYGIVLILVMVTILL